MKFKVGDRVRVRKWEDMANDYRTFLKGESIVDAVNERVEFAKYMEKFCELPAIVREVKSPDEINLYFIGDTTPEQYYFSEWMLEDMQ